MIDFIDLDATIIGIYFVIFAAAVIGNLVIYLIRTRKKQNAKLLLINIIDIL